MLHPKRSWPISHGNQDVHAARHNFPRIGGTYPRCWTKAAPPRRVFGRLHPGSSFAGWPGRAGPPQTRAADLYAQSSDSSPKNDTTPMPDYDITEPLRHSCCSGIAQQFRPPDREAWSISRDLAVEALPQIKRLLWNRPSWPPTTPKQINTINTLLADGFDRTKHRGHVALSLHLSGQHGDLARKQFPGHGRGGTELHVLCDELPF